MSTGEPETSAALPANEAELRREIEQERERLGETVEQLAAKTDVRGQARAKAHELQARAVAAATVLVRKRSLPLAIGGAMLILSAVAFRRWHSR